DRDAVEDLLFRPPVATLQLEIAVLLDGPLQHLGGFSGSRSRRGFQVRQGGAEAAQEVADLAAIAVELLVGAGEEGVVVPHDLVDALGVQGLQVFETAAVLDVEVFDAAQEVGMFALVALACLDQVLEEDQVERPLAVPEVLLGSLGQRPEEALEEDDEATDETAMALDGERVVPPPEPLPVVQIAGGLDEEVVEGRHAALGGLIVRLHASRAVGRATLRG